MLLESLLNRQFEVLTQQRSIDVMLVSFNYRVLVYGGEFRMHDMTVAIESRGRSVDSVNYSSLHIRSTGRIQAASRSLPYAGVLKLRTFRNPTR